MKILNSQLSFKLNKNPNTKFWENLDDKLPRNDLGGQSNKSLTLLDEQRPREGQSKT